MEEKRNTRRRTYKGQKQLQRNRSIIVKGVRRHSAQVTTSIGFASSEDYIAAVEKIYLQELRDIERFVRCQ